MVQILRNQDSARTPLLGSSIGFRLLVGNASANEADLDHGGAGAGIVSPFLARCGADGRPAFAQQSAGSIHPEMQSSDAVALKIRCRLPAGIGRVQCSLLLFFLYAGRIRWPEGTPFAGSVSITRRELAVCAEPFVTGSFQKMFGAR